MDSKGRKVGEEWFTTCKVDDALNRYICVSLIYWWYWYLSIRCICFSDHVWS